MRGVVNGDAEQAVYKTQISRPPRRRRLSSSSSSSPFLLSFPLTLVISRLFLK